MNLVDWKTIWTFWRDGGPLLLPLGLLCFCLWYLFLRSRRRLLRAIALCDKALPPETPLEGPFENPWLARADNDIRLLRALTTAAPMVGLLGTVSGMVETFHAVAFLRQIEVVDRLAPGIRQALITTELGLVIAIPGVFGAARLERLAEQVDVRLKLKGPPIAAGDEEKGPA